MPELVLYGIRELAPAIPWTTPRHRGGELWAKDTKVYTGDLTKLHGGKLFEIKTELKENFVR